MTWFTRAMILLGLCLSTVFSVFSEEPILKIGAILPLSGSLAYAGDALQKGMQLALDQPEASDIRLIFQDDQTVNRKAAVEAANKLIGIDGVSIILNSVVSTAWPLVPIIEKQKIPALVIWDCSDSIGKANPYLFGSGFSTERAGSDLARFAREKLSLPSVSIIEAHDEWSEIIAESFRLTFEELGGKVLNIEKVSIDATEMRAEIARSVANQTPAIYVPLYGPSLITFIKQARAGGFNGTILSADGFSASELEIVKNVIGKIYSSNSWFENKLLSEKFRAKFKSEVNAINMGFVAIGYDSIRHLVELKARLKMKNLDLTPASVLTELDKFKYEGLMGVTDFSEARASCKLQRILTVKDGVITLADG